MTGNVPDGLKANAIAAGNSMMMCSRKGTEAHVRDIDVRVEYLQLTGQSEVVVLYSSVTIFLVIQESARKL